MTLSAADREALTNRNQLTDAEKELIRITLNDMDFRASNILNTTLASDDRLAALEAALVRYVLASRGVDVGIDSRGFPLLDIDKVLWKDEPMHIRAKNERKVIYAMLNELEGKGFKLVSVYDGENDEPATTVKEVMELIFNLDECRVYLKKEGYKAHNIYYVLGNADDGSEVAADWNYTEGDPDGFNEAMDAFKPEDHV